MNRIFIIVAVVCFAVLFVISVFSLHADKSLSDGLFYGGLTAFAAAHL